MTVQQRALDYLDKAIVHLQSQSYADSGWGLPFAGEAIGTTEGL